ncbi:MAG TPA: AAA family ATPase [Trebonia sp.]|nr:AAA family ATPase [Trebonia sp.]
MGTRALPGTGAFVGRAAELGGLRALLDDALLAPPGTGRAVVALIRGDAGIGKSRLVAEASAIAAGHGVTVLRGQCAEIGDSVPWLPFADALRGGSLDPGSAARLAEAARKRPVLSGLLPDGTAGPPPDGDQSGLARQQMFGAVLGLLSELAAQDPVLLVLEDLHWADASTRDLLTFLSRMLHRERVVIIGTYRADDLHRRHPLRAVVADLRRLPSVTEIELGPLSSPALADLLSALPQAPPGGQGPLSAATLDQIVERAEGNPYYAEELLAAASEPAAPGRAPGLPSGLAALLLSRVERLPDAAQQVLRAAAAAGRRADDDLIAAVVADVFGLAGAEYDAAAREAVAHQLLVPDAGGAGRYAFRHALVREAVYSDLLPGERTRLHGRLAELLAARLAASGEGAGGHDAGPAAPGALAELAHHSLASLDVAGGFTASVRAGHEAHHLGAPAEAHRHYDQALALWERVPDAAARAGMSRGWLAFRSATAAAHAGDVPRAIAQLRRLRDWVGEDDDDIELRSRAGERLAHFIIQLDSPEAAREALRVAAGTVRETPAQPPTVYRARAMATYALTLMVAQDYDAALDWAQRGQELARQAGAPWVEADALITIGLLASRSGETDRAIATFTAAGEQAAGSGMIGVELRAAYHLARERLALGELGEAARLAHQGVRRAEAEGLGLAPFGFDLQHLHFQAHYADGSWDHAQEIADGFMARVSRQAEAVLSAMALFIDVARGNPAVADRRAWLEPFWSDGFVAYIGRGLLAEHALWQGDAGRALAHADAAIRADEWPARSPAVLRVAAVALSARADRAAQARAGGDEAALAAETGAAAELLAIAREGASFPSRPKSFLGPEGRGWLARCEAEYQRAAGRNDPGHWRAVLAEFGSGEAAFPYEDARARWRLAEALVAAGQREEAIAAWQSAVATATRLGAAPLRAALDDLGRRARLGPGTPGTPGTPGAPGEHGGHRPSAGGGLTDREREVLRLVAQGKTNREIAAELFIAPKTASVHVSNILGKLGAGSRTEAAAIAHRDGL